MKEPKFHVTLIPARDEPPVCELQKELGEFDDRTRSVSAEIRLEAAFNNAIPPLSGDFVLKLVSSVGPVLGVAVGSWLRGRYGRKVRLKIDGIEAEASTPEDVEKLLNKAQEIRERNEPKRIFP